jgi:hypothetical protein
MKRVEKYYCIVYDSDNGQGFIVTHREKGTSRAFFESTKGLHYSDFQTHLKEQFSRKDVRRAELVRRLHNSKGPVSLEDYISAVSTG